MGKNSENVDLRKIRRMLHETVRLAEQASMTGSLEKGGRFAIRQYNAIRERLEEWGAIPHDLFQHLDEDETSFDELGVACAMLEGYLADEGETTEAPPPPRGQHGPHKVVFSGWGGAKDLEELRELGQIIRSHLPDWIKYQTPPEPPVPPSPPSPPPPPPPPGEEEVIHPPQSNREERLAEINRRFQEIAEELGRKDLSEEQRADLIAQLTRLGQEQAHMTRL